MKTCQLVFVPKISRLAKVDGVSIWNAQAPPRSVLFGPSSPGHWDGSTLQETLHLGLGEKQGKTTNKTGKRQVLVVVYKEYPATLGHQLGSCFLLLFVFSFSGWVQIYTIVVSFSWKELDVEWGRWRMGKEGRRWLLGKTSRILDIEVQSWIVVVLSSRFFTCFWWRFPEILWPKQPKGIQRAISLQSLVSQYANSVGRNASRNGLTCQMKVIIESPEKSSHDVWWILKILCSQTKALLGTSPKIDEFYKQFYIFYILTSAKLQVTCSSQEAHNLQLWWKSSRFPDPTVCCKLPLLKRCCFFSHHGFCCPLRISR